MPNSMRGQGSNKKTTCGTLGIMSCVEREEVMAGHCNVLNNDPLALETPRNWCTDLSLSL
jgi:hypothetical protein